MNRAQWSEFLITYEQCVAELVTKFQNLEEEYILLDVHSPIQAVYGRVKKKESIVAKAKRKNIELSEIHPNIEDIAGIRIICKFVKDIEIVVENIRNRSGYDLEIVEERDYITNTKESGYRSYHFIVNYKVMTVNGIKEVRAEIQIRTMAMNFWATIEHSLRYKYNNNLPDDLKDRLTSAAEAVYMLDMEMNQIRDEAIYARQLLSIDNKI